jgi:hypothetical protein
VTVNGATPSRRKVTFTSVAVELGLASRKYVKKNPCEPSAKYHFERTPSVA